MFSWVAERVQRIFAKDVQAEPLAAEASRLNERQLGECGIDAWAEQPIGTWQSDQVSLRQEELF